MKNIILAVLIVAVSAVILTTVFFSKYKTQRECVEDVIVHINKLYQCNAIVVLPINEPAELVISVAALGDQYSAFTNGPEGWMKINDDEQLYRLPYTVSHELGHVFGLPHFKSSKCELMAARTPWWYPPTEEAVIMLKNCLDSRRINPCKENIKVRLDM
jgi:predicted Zn-dependent protease